jgi:chromosome segregation ATPase
MKARRDADPAEQFKWLRANLKRFTAERDAAAGEYHRLKAKCEEIEKDMATRRAARAEEMAEDERIRQEFASQTAQKAAPAAEAQPAPEVPADVISSPVAAIDGLPIVEDA